MFPDILRAEEFARSLLLSQNMPRLPVDVQRLRHNRDISISSMQQFCRVTNISMEELSAGSDCLRDGCTIIIKRRLKPLYLVLYNEDMRGLRRRGFTLAHELGHIFLDHECDGDLKETEANFFAAELLVPQVLANTLLKQNAWRDPAREINRFFGVSLDMARRRLRYLDPEAPLAPSEEKLLLRYGALLPQMSEPVVDY